MSGSINTAGGLIFVGRSDGRLTALDKTNGHKLWEFNTDAGVNSTASTFMHKGHQYVAVLSAGTLFGAGKKGDSVWLFSLKGKIEPIPPMTSAGQKSNSVVAQLYGVKDGPDVPPDAAGRGRTWPPARSCSGASAWRATVKPGSAGMAAGPRSTTSRRIRAPSTRR